MTSWTEDRIARLKTLWREGRTAEFIAQDLGAGISRSAVLGKVRRLGIETERLTPIRRGPRPGRARPSPGCGPSRLAAAGDTAGQPAPMSGRRTILTVRSRECRWPFGDPLGSDFSLCGRRVSRGAFCEGHADAAYRRPAGALDALADCAHIE